MIGLKIVVDRNLHIIELDLNAIEKRVVIGSTRSDLIESIDHLDNTVQYPLRKNEAQVTRCGIECRNDRILRKTRII